MTEITKYGPGNFCWEDLYTTDVAAAKSFYQNLFGWNVQDVDRQDKAIYSIFSIKDKEVCGVSKLKVELQRQNVRPHWTTYIAVANVAEFIKIVKLAGGKILKPPKDIYDAGKRALIQDPTGGIFAVWQPHTKIGALIADVPGSASWRELETSDVDVAGKFYSTIFNWTPKPERFGDIGYVTLKLDTNSVGGMMNLPKEGLPTVWLTYWRVENCENSANKCQIRGGKILNSTTLIKGVGKVAILTDPQGATFAIIEPKID